MTSKLNGNTVQLAFDLGTSRTQRAELLSNYGMGLHSHISVNGNDKLLQTLKLSGIRAEEFQARESRLSKVLNSLRNLVR